uniref:Uncharacterized protein n=1 Tax=Anguilla anguilla TaxID=7936 RepID=A0A0E9QI55_ANGAN
MFADMEKRIELLMRMDYDSKRAILYHL